MEKLPVGAAFSVAVHAILVTYGLAYTAELDEPDERLGATVEIVPVEVAVVELPPEPARREEEPPAAIATPSPPRAQPPPPRPAPASADAQLSTSARPSLETAIETAPTTGSSDTTSPGTAEPSPGAAPRSAWFDLRRGRPAVDLRLPAGMRDDLDRVPRGTDAAPAALRSGQLQESGGGTHRSDQGPFTARVERDGSVTLKDRRNLNVGLALPTPRSIGNGISRWYYSDKGEDGQRGERALEKEVGGSTDAEDRSKTVIIPVLRGGFDITDALMRSKGADPYASKKLAFLDATRDERVAIGTAHRAQQLRHTAQHVQQNLEQLWRSVSEPAARKEALFEVWDEIVEGGDAAGAASAAEPDAAALVAEAGRSARALVIGFIRAKLPAGSPGAYSPEEIAALNQRRQSKALFVPYEAAGSAAEAR